MLLPVVVFVPFNTTVPPPAKVRAELPERLLTDKMPEPLFVQAWAAPRATGAVRVRFWPKPDDMVMPLVRVSVLVPPMDTDPLGLGFRDRLARL